MKPKSLIDETDETVIIVQLLKKDSILSTEIMVIFVKIRLNPLAYNRH